MRIEEMLKTCRKSPKQVIRKAIIPLSRCHLCGGMFAEWVLVEKERIISDRIYTEHYRFHADCLFREEVLSEAVQRKLHNAIVNLNPQSKFHGFVYEADATTMHDIVHNIVAISLKRLMHTISRKR
jgi:hypothetical protein